MAFMATTLPKAFKGEIDCVGIPAVSISDYSVVVDRGRQGRDHSFNEYFFWLVDASLKDHQATTSLNKKKAIVRSSQWTRWN